MNTQTICPGCRCNHYHLTPSEHQIVLLICEGLNNDAISVRLGVSPKTIKNHLARIYPKLGVASRLELAVKILQEQTQEHKSEGA